MAQATVSTRASAGTLEAEVRAAARAFAEALAKADEFQTWKQAARALRQDQAAQAAAKQLQVKQHELQTLLMLRAATDEQRLELEELRSAYLAFPTVLATMQAETGLRALCQAANEALSVETGLDFATNCASGCCG